MTIGLKGLLDGNEFLQGIVHYERADRSAIQKHGNRQPESGRGPVSASDCRLGQYERFRGRCESDRIPRQFVHPSESFETFVPASLVGCQNQGFVSESLTYIKESRLPAVVVPLGQSERNLKRAFHFGACADLGRSAQKVSGQCRDGE